MRDIDERELHEVSGASNYGVMVCKWNDQKKTWVCEGAAPDAECHGYACTELCSHSFPDSDLQ